MLFWLKKIFFLKKFLRLVDLNDKKEYSKAYAQLKLLRMNSFYEKFISIFPEYEIIEAEILFNNGKIDESKKKFLDSIEKIEKSDQFSKDEKNYLKEFIINWLHHIYEIDKSLIQKKFIFQHDTEYDPSKIRKSIKINFPMANKSDQ